RCSSRARTRRRSTAGCATLSTMRRATAPTRRAGSSSARRPRRIGRRSPSGSPGWRRSVQDVAALSPALEAFDAVAARFDIRFGAWRSVAAQRRAVRRTLAAAFPRGAYVLEIGGGTGEDARWLAARGRVVQLTDGSPTMVRIAHGKLRSQGGPLPRVVAAEELDRWATERESA